MADQQDVKTTALDVGELQPCSGCGKGMMHSGNPVFYEVELRQCIVDMKSCQQMAGLEMVMGGNVPIARVLAPSTRAAFRLGDRKRHLVCIDCAMKPLDPVAVMLSED